jgi:tetratricopeptide (TPR) repeat protein
MAETPPSQTVASDAGLRAAMMASKVVAEAGGVIKLGTKHETVTGSVHHNCGPEPDPQPVPKSDAPPLPEPEPELQPAPVPEPEPAGPGGPGPEDSGPGGTGPEPEAEPGPDAVETLREPTAEEGIPPAGAAKDLGPEFPNVGICIEGLEQFARDHPEITPKHSTSAVCHTVIKPMTVPDGWLDKAVLTNPEKGWYSHEYLDRGTGKLQKAAPVGTSSYCEKLRDNSHTSHLVAEPTVFFSHAWGFCFLNVLAAMRAFVDAQPPGSPQVFFWFDTFSIDEHATQQLPQDWWGTTFKDAVEKIGHTAMMLSPWDAPVPLTRAWCLWELYCTVLAGARFSVLLGPAERAAFEGALVDDFDVVLAAFANVDVREAEAGSAADQTMILTAAETAPGGFGRLNEVAIRQLRNWIVNAAKDMVQRQVLAIGGDVASLWTACNAEDDEVPLSRAGSLSGLPVDALKVVAAVSNVLTNLGEANEAMALAQEVVAERCSLLGATHTDTLRAKMNQAGLLHRQGDLAEASKLYIEVISQYTASIGAIHNDTLRAQLNFANLLRDQGELAQARHILEMVIDAYSISTEVGPSHTRTLDAQMTLSAILHQQGELKASRSLKIAVVDGFTSQLGKRNFRTLEAQNNLALLLMDSDESAEAQRLLRLVVEGWSSQFGRQHKNTLTAQMNLAVCLHHSHSIEAARQLYAVVASGFESTLGTDHIDTLTAQMNLATILTEVGDDATQLHRLVLQGFISKLGARHPRSLDAQFNLAKALIQNDDTSGEARILLEAVVAGRGEKLGADHIDTLTAQMDLGILLDHLDETVIACKMYKVALCGFIVKLGPEHIDTLRAEFNLAQLLHVQGEDAESIELRRAGSQVNIVIACPSRTAALSWYTKRWCMVDGCRRALNYVWRRGGCMST